MLSGGGELEELQEASLTKVDAIITLQDAIEQDFDTKIDTINNMIRNLMNALTEKEKELHAIRNTLQERSANLENVKANIRELEERTKRGDTEKQSSLEQIEKLQAENIRLQGEIAELKTREVNLTADRDNLKNTLDEANEKLRISTESHSALNTKVNTVYNKEESQKKNYESRLEETTKLLRDVFDINLKTRSESSNNGDAAAAAAAAAAAEKKRQEDEQQRPENPPSGPSDTQGRRQKTQK
jgi:chromosome segregation ATPase